MDNNLLLNSNNTGKFLDRRLKTLLLIAFLILVWIIITQYFSSYIKSNITQNWNEIASEKISQQTGIIQDLFDNYQSDVNKLSESISSNPDIVRQVQKSESKKLFEELLNLNSDNSYQIEIYNTRLELLAFKGRRLDSDIYSLQKCLNGKKYSVLKEIGFYTYLIIYTPVYDLKEKTQILGVMLTAKLIDIKYQINNKFFRNVGLLNDINKITKVTPELIPANVISGKIDFDSSFIIDNVDIYLKGIDGSTIGLMLLPKYGQLTHTQNVDSFSKRINSLLIFGLTVILFLILYKFLLRLNSNLSRFIFFSFILIVIRFIWLEFHFPARTFESEIFSPGFYASGQGFGVAKSIGELLITSVFVLIISLYAIKLVSNRNIRGGNLHVREYMLLTYLKSLFLILCFFALIFFYGSGIQSIIFDSNLKFFDKTSIIPNFELFIVQVIILVLSFSLFVSLSAIIILIYKNSFTEISENKSLRKYFVFILLLILLICNQYAAPIFDDFKIDYLYRVLVIVFSLSFGIYLGSKIILSKNYNIYSVKNFSLIILFCIITIPGILLEKITSQETYFVELIGRKISEKGDDKIKFLLMTELSNISEGKNLENNLKNKNKLPELAFSVWINSKFSEENFNTAIIVTDTNKKMLSDFIFNSQSLNADSILSYADNNFFKKKSSFKTISDTSVIEDSLEITEDEAETSDEEFPAENNIENDNETNLEANTDEIDNLYITDKILVLKNETEKYYLGIVPIEKVDLKNTIFETNLGYLFIAVQYESKNFLTQSSMQLFKNYSKDNLFDKLISTPVITEYTGGDIVSSTNQDLSKANTVSLDAFRESIKYKIDKYDWRYEVINGERYRTLYIQGIPEESSGYERIFSISLKRNDFKLTTFFYLKFILFVVFLYLFILAIISAFLLFKIKKFRLNFREKLFASFFIVSVIPIVLLAIYTRSFIKDKYDSNFKNQIISDLNLVSQSLKGNQLILNNLDSLSKEQNQQLTKSLYQTEKNFNLYLKTNLVSTTNEELYKSDLLDTRIVADAYYNIVYLRKDFFMKAEEIGVYSFIVGYKPFFDSKNNLVGLMSSQTVYKQNEINEELTEILTFIFGIYFIVIIILLVFVTFLTDRISKPILKLQNATERISQGESNIELKIKRKDEIGNLVDSFNKMTKELESSKNKLKKAEREAAWRDIARRVAHEIKNPLTPMKLSIQHLYDVYNNGNKNNFPEVLKKTRNIIISEIDKLNRIATEFSTFAKLSGRSYKKTDLNEVIEEVVSLYKLAPNIEFKESLDKNIDKIFADKQELNRVFQNLIKNSIQAIEDFGVIEVKTYNNSEGIIAEIIDNGVGIDSEIMKNLFEPNFSTKSGGMGLGLAITKKSLDDMKAEIHFESLFDKGTRVIIKFKPIS
ncbi:MAG: ATP-binding protein [Bacteroidota bacterium]|nr:ATP-binding protein [Bacteroidota bacterium]